MALGARSAQNDISVNLICKLATEEFLPYCNTQFAARQAPKQSENKTTNHRDIKPQSNTEDFWASSWILASLGLRSEAWLGSYDLIFIVRCASKGHGY